MENPIEKFIELRNEIDEVLSKNESSIEYTAERILRRLEELKVLNIENYKTDYTTEIILQGLEKLNYKPDRKEGE